MLKVGMNASASLEVSEEMLVPAFGRNFPAWKSVPSVTATIVIIGLIEEACLRVLDPFLRAGETTLGVRVDVQHLAPTPLGAILNSTAVLKTIGSSAVVFDVECSDGIECVARGTHTRVIVDRSAFLRVVDRKLVQVAQSRAGP